VPLTPVSVSVAPAERVRRRRRSDRSLVEQLARVSKKLSSVGQIELLQMQSYPKFHNEIGVPIVRVGCREFECIGAMPPQDHPHITSIWAMRVESSAPIAPRYSISIRVWAHMKLIRQIVLTVTWTE